MGDCCTRNSRAQVAVLRRVPESRWGLILTAAVLISFAILAATTAAHAQTFTVIHNFAGGLDGSEPSSGLTIDQAGNLYGSTFEGDAGTGTTYKLSNRGGGWVLQPLLYYNNQGKGVIPYDRPIFGPNGSLYLSVGYGGVGPCQTYNGTGCGAVVNLQPPLTPPVSPLVMWLDTPLYKFTGGSDGANPYSGDIIFDHAGNIYGTAFNGGTSTTSCPSGCGVVYELMHTSNGWTESVLYSFSGPDGSHPWAGLTFDQAGNLYGTTSTGGSSNLGTIFELSPSGGSWTLTTLRNFSGGDGAYPYAGLIFDAAGNLYGASTSMGPNSGGTAYELSPNGSGWTYTVLYNFTGPNGGLYPGPVANLVFDSQGNLYGTAHLDGAFNFGSVFKLTNTGSGWTYTSLHDFTAGVDGGDPRSNITFDSHGNMYGTASEGGTGNPQNCVGACGVIFEITPQ